MAGSSLGLTEEQQDLKDWVHGFAGFESLADLFGDPSGISLQIANEELFWGDAGIGMALSGTSLAVAGIFSSGTPDQLAIEVSPART
ncbi:hypothetical protein QIT00_08240 [Streptomyces sp. B-S-A12]|uniref:Uncharacterized protein n=1 Tax=Streptomyces luteolus TaxID=3043615 RepID=A0ABT6SSH0_9ACTN|nr:hypothetical protein [Streptomyces sp. B-S-A12]MDI3418552.1 hypothetical protein [Streptomyces sp. B-S-A12]